MKKLLAFILVFALCLLPACGTVDEDGASAPVPSAPIDSTADSQSNTLADSSEEETVSGTFTTNSSADSNSEEDSSVDLSQPTENTEDNSKEETEMYTVKMEVKDYGTITLELDPTYAPITVANFVKLADMGFYDGLIFHRVIKGFMIQGGDPNHNGTGGSDTNIKGEFAANGVNNPLAHKRGVISMARSGDPNSASSQFFIMHEDSPHLDGLYAAFGVVTDGMDVVDAIANDARPIDYNGTMLYEEQPVITKVTVVK